MKGCHHDRQHSWQTSVPISMIAGSRGNKTVFHSSHKILIKIITMVGVQITNNNFKINMLSFLAYAIVNLDVFQHFPVVPENENNKNNNSNDTNINDKNKWQRNQSWYLSAPIGMSAGKRWFNCCTKLSWSKTYNHLHTKYSKTAQHWNVNRMTECCVLITVRMNPHGFCCHHGQSEGVQDILAV